MLYVIAAIAVLALIAGIGGKLLQAGGAEERARTAQAQAVADTAQRALEQEKSDHIADMVTVAQVGENNVRVALAGVARVKAQQITSLPVFQNLSCEWPKPVVDNLNAARATITGNLLEPAAAVGPPAPAAPPAAAPGARGASHPKPVPVK